MQVCSRADTEHLCLFPGGARPQGQNAQQGRHSSAEGPWQPEDAEAQREYMRQRAVQRAQVHTNAIMVGRTWDSTCLMAFVAFLCGLLTPAQAALSVCPGHLRNQPKFVL